MKNKYLLSLLWVIVSGFGVLMAQEIAIIPQPAHLIVKNEKFLNSVSSSKSVSLLSG